MSRGRAAVDPLDTSIAAARRNFKSLVRLVSLPKWELCWSQRIISVGKGRPDRLTSPPGGSERSERGGMFHPTLASTDRLARISPAA